MIQIYHNPKCSKSRECLVELENLNLSFEVLKYLEIPITKSELKNLLIKLNYTAIDLVRTKENIWIEKYKTKKLAEEEIIEALLLYPKLIERPIVVNHNKAVVARPIEKIKEIL